MNKKEADSIVVKNNSIESASEYKIAPVLQNYDFMKSKTTKLRICFSLLENGQGVHSHEEWIKVIGNAGLSKVR